MIVLNFPETCPICKSSNIYPFMPKDAFLKNGKLNKNYKMKYDILFQCDDCDLQFGTVFVGQKDNCVLYLIGTPGGSIPWGIVPLESDVNPDNKEDIMTLHNHLVERLSSIFIPEQISIPLPIDKLVEKGKFILKCINETITDKDKEYFKLYDKDKDKKKHNTKS